MIFRPLDAGRLRLSNRLMAPPHASAINDLFGTPEQAESHLGDPGPQVEAGLGWVDGITGYIGNHVPPGFDPTGLGAVTQGASGFACLPRARRSVRRPAPCQRRLRDGRAPPPGRHAPGAAARKSSYLSHQMPHVIETSELQWLIDESVFPARQVDEAGIDGVELHANNDDLLQRVLVAVYQRANRRLRRHRRQPRPHPRRDRRCDPNCREPHVQRRRPPRGRRAHRGRLHERRRHRDRAVLEEHGIDFLHGVIGNPWGAPTYIPPPPYPPGAFAGLVGRVKAEIDVPVVYTGRVTSPSVAERILADGQADVVGMARPLDLGSRAGAQGPRGSHRGHPAVHRLQRVHQQGVGGAHPVQLLGQSSRRSGVVAAPAVPVWPEPEAPVGGGWRAGRAGAGRCGGRARLRRDALGARRRARWPAAGGVPRSGLEDFARYVTYQRRRLEQLGVEVATGYEADSASVVDAGPDVVGVATGARSRRPTSEGIDAAHVHDIRPVLLGDATRRRRAGGRGGQG